jgi:hypothetical protein
MIKYIIRKIRIKLIVRKIKKNLESDKFIY